MKLIATKSRLFLKNRFQKVFLNQESYENPLIHSQTILNYIGIPKKTLISNFNAMEDNETLTRDIRLISTIFKNFIANSAEYLLIKSNPLDKYNIKSVINDFSSFTITDTFYVNYPSEDKVLKNN